MRAVRAPALLCVGAALVLTACASSGVRLAPGESGLRGVVRLVPHEGLSAGGSGGGYGDRRLRDARLVDYDRPGFAVVYLDNDLDQHLDRTTSPEGSAPPLEIVIRDATVGARLDPSEAAIPLGGRIRVSNASSTSHVLSAPSGGTVQTLAPGEARTLQVEQPGPHRLFLLDDAAAKSLVFASPGPFAVTRTSGEYELVGLAPGTARVRVWHPRFPPVHARVDLLPDVIADLDLVLGVGRDASGDEHE